MYGLHFREEYDEPIARELDALVAKLKAFMLREHNEDGTHNFGMPGQYGNTGESAVNLVSNPQSFQFLIQQLLANEDFTGGIGGGDVVGPASAVDDDIATFDGTTGKLIQDSGISAADVSTISNLPNTSLLLKRQTITNAQLETLNATPVTVIAAPGPDKVIVPVHWAHRLVKGATGWSVNAVFRLQYAGSTTSLCNTMVSGLTGNGDPPYGDSGNHIENQWASGGGFDTRNKSVEVTFAADTNQGAAEDATAYLHILYYILSIG